jgi:hypothetical protein
MTTPDFRLNRITSLSRELVMAAGDITLRTNDDIDRGSFDFAKWSKSMLNLWDLTLSNSLDVAPDMFAPCFLPCLHLPSDQPEESDYIIVEPKDVARKVEVVPSSFKHDGSPSFGIPDPLLCVDPPVLQPHATRFQVKVLWSGLRSGTYRGIVRLIPEGPSDVVIDDILGVIIDL